jgi:hypothetical protein
MDQLSPLHGKTHTLILALAESKVFFRHRLTSIAVNIRTKIFIATLVPAFKIEPAEGIDLDFYHLGGNTVKPKVRHQEGKGVQLPLKISILRP